jgi:hypothetical protein
VRQGKVWDFYFLLRSEAMEFDISEIGPGSVIEQADIEKAIGFSQASNWRDYQFKLMTLQGELSKLLADDGRDLTVCINGGSLQVLTHEEASKYNDAASRNAIHKMQRCLRRSLAVDTGEFDSDTLRFHEKSVMRQSRILQAIKTVSRKRMTLDAKEDNRPKIILKPRNN